MVFTKDQERKKKIKYKCIKDLAKGYSMILSLTLSFNYFFGNKEVECYILNECQWKNDTTKIYQTLYLSQIWFMLNCGETIDGSPTHY